MSRHIMSCFFLSLCDILQLYPTPDGDKYKELMPELFDTGVDLNFKQRTNLETPEVHDILARFEARQSTATSNSRISEGTTIIYMYIYISSFSVGITKIIVTC